MVCHLPFTVIMRKLIKSGFMEDNKFQHGAFLMYYRGLKGIRPERYNQEVLSHPFICLPLPYIEAIVLIALIFIM